MRITLPTPRLALVVALLAFLLCTGCSAPVIPDGIGYLRNDTRGATQGVRARYFGVSTVLLYDSESSILIDGFFSRPSLARLIFGPVRPDEDQIEFARRRGGFDKVDLLLVSHAHVDHAMDVGPVAIATKARVVGSSSVETIALSQGVKSIQVIDHQGEVEQGKFRICVFHLDHAQTPFFVRFTGDIEPPMTPWPNLATYREGINHAYLITHDGTRILVVPSASHTSKLPGWVRADIVLLGIGTLGKKKPEEIEAYWHNMVGASNARKVVPIHWDDFTVPLSQPLRPMPMIADDMANTIRIFRGLAGSKVELGLLPTFVPTVLTSK